MTQEPDWKKVDKTDEQAGKPAQAVDPHGEPQSPDKERPEAL